MHNMSIRSYITQYNYRIPFGMQQTCIVCALNQADNASHLSKEYSGINILTCIKYNGPLSQKRIFPQCVPPCFPHVSQNVWMNVNTTALSCVSFGSWSSKSLKEQHPYLVSLVNGPQSPEQVFSNRQDPQGRRCLSAFILLLLLPDLKHQSIPAAGYFLNLFCLLQDLLSFDVVRGMVFYQDVLA